MNVNFLDNIQRKLIGYDNMSFAIFFSKYFDKWEKIFPSASNSSFLNKIQFIIQFILLKWNFWWTLLKKCELELFYSYQWRNGWIMMWNAQKWPECIESYFWVVISVSWTYPYFQHPRRIVQTQNKWKTNSLFDSNRK